MTETPEGVATPKPTREGQRIAKVMARAGLCSRRDAEAWILEGRVIVNGQTLDSPAFNVTADDDVRVDGQRLKEAERTRLFLFHKPRGLVTTARDPEGRPTIFDALPEDLPRVVAVGRLDINTEGLLLVTNDGGLARVLELPATGWLRRYRVRAHGAIEQERLDALREGLTIDGVHYAGIDARLEREQGSNVWLMMGLREGKNREIKRVLEHLGLSVNRLIRVSFGPFELGDLAEGEVAEVRTRVLRDQLGAKLAREAGVNFDAEIVDHAVPQEAPRPAPRGARAERGRPEGRRPEREGFAPRKSAQRSEPEPAHAAPRKRKHVTALRAEAEAEASGPRRRVERGATSDRRGREVKVERIMTANPPARSRRDDDGSRAFRHGAPRAGASDRSARASDRPARRFEEHAPGGDARAPRGEGKPFGKRPSEGRFAARGDGGSFDTRGSGEGRSPSREGRSFGKRPPAGEGRSFEKRASSDDRAASRGGGKPFGKRPPSGEGRTAGRGEGRSFEARGSSGEGRAPSREGKPFGKRPPSGEGRSAVRGEGRSFEARGASGEGRAPSREGRTFGKRPPAGEGRSFEKRGAAEGRPAGRGGGKPFAGRSSSSEGRGPNRSGGTPPGKRPSGGGAHGGGRPPRRP
jgi:23S rRNA pseudouridine2605 synthase